MTDRLAARAERKAALDSAVTEVGPSQNNIAAGQIVNRAAAVKDWLQSPSAVAGRVIDTPTLPAPTTLWTPPRFFTAPLGTMKATPGTSSITGRSSLLTTVLNVVNPLAGNTPGSPAGVDSPFALISASAARREVGIESFMTQALLDPSSTSLTYAPDIGYDVGIISGCNLETPTGLAYFVAKQPDGGGKVYLDPQTGNLTYLPDLSSVIDPDAVETFSVVVVKPTALTSAVTGIPLVGYLASQVLVVLYQIPVVNVGFVPDHRPVQGDQGVDSAKRCHGGSHGSSRVHGEDRVSKRRHADQHQITSRQFLW